MSNAKFESFSRVLTMTVLSVALLACCFSFVKSAKAGEFDIMVSGDYQYWITDNVMFYGEGWHQDNYGYNFNGMLFAIQPEYRFNDWFALGLDVGAGALFVEEPPEEITEKLVQKMFVMDFLVTARFIKKYEHVEFWGEIGMGAALNSILDDELVHYAGYDEPTRTNAAFKARLRAGLTGMITDSFGLGANVALSWEYFDAGPTMQEGISFMQTAFPVNAGIHAVYKF